MDEHRESGWATGPLPSVERTAMVTALPHGTVVPFADLTYALACLLADRRRPTTMVDLERPTVARDSDSSTTYRFPGLSVSGGGSPRLDRTTIRTVLRYFHQ